MAFRVFNVITRVVVEEPRGLIVEEPALIHFFQTILGISKEKEPIWVMLEYNAYGISD